ncbi:antitoxin [Aquincola sp. S2]|uniref:Antitoxin n=1 Tax=Pseudaquabacterium terrae TaxID=2732868 RepID=A0ABX2EV46_9BURK|nr:antitoxin [Aquabacterium terrae]NRF72337.1 antitoxin [Aquabacterium terrae]
MIPVWQDEIHVAHHDASRCGIMMLSKWGLQMRTTITLDPDVKALLAEAAYRSGKPFKVTLNDAVRAGLAPRYGKAPAPDWPCHDLGSARVDLTKALALADELEDQEQAAKLARGA